MDIQEKRKLLEWYGTMGLSHRFITNCLRFLAGKHNESLEELRQAYFVGRTLYLDVGPSYDVRVLCLNYDKERYGLLHKIPQDPVQFRLLSIEDLRLMEVIMDKSYVSYSPKMI